MKQDKKRALATILCMVGTTFASQAQEEAVYPIAEYDRASTIIMHEPNNELFVGTMHPAAALFMDYFDADEAAKEHLAYQEILREEGANVVTVREILLRDCVDEEGNIKEGDALDDLRDLASKYLVYTCDSTLDAAEQEAYRQEMLKKFHPNDLVDIILQQPEIQLRATSINTNMEATYLLHPVMNLFFMRDQVITTSKGIVIGKMNSSQRDAESDIVEFCYRKLGEEPIYRIQGDSAFLEGGDYLPFGSLSFMGQGLRTSQAAIDQLLENDLIGKDTLVVVRDAWKSQDQMHLDTYFNIIDKDLVTLCANRVNAEQGDIDFLTIDIYAKDGNGRYQKTQSGIPFVDFLTQRGIEIIPIEQEDELNYANNFLTIGARKIVMVAGQSLALQEDLRSHGVDVIWAHLENLTRGYGAAHCMTQVIRRTPVDDPGTSVAAISDHSSQITGGKGEILIVSEQPCEVGIFTVDGKQITNLRSVTSTRYPISAGIYIVKTTVDSQGTKVLVK